MRSIKTIETRMFRVPLAEVLCDARHGAHSHFELITATVELADGSRSTGYTYTGGRGGGAIKCMIDNDLVPALIGRDGSSPESILDRMNWHVHYVGRVCADGMALNGKKNPSLANSSPIRSNLPISELVVGYRTDPGAPVDSPDHPGLPPDCRL